ncbi:unnamed protein product [Clonostachys rosea f. rosea IK726]|uniref:Zn(2)-C6 fungal-type domain-containing protein n=2 Tax=Bionectria ochroleuca TaxID=29856 RepID=A0A0B7K205_BIOOC|nr:unnamed protein product [Clonostachys rosea f. rosea IK726]
MDPKTPARHRHRATAACMQCRKARIRCVLDPESKKCQSCRDIDQECVYDEKDGRKSRTSAKAIESTLMQRINHLENQLKEAKGTPKPLDTETFEQAPEEPPPYTSPEASSSRLASVENASTNDDGKSCPEQATSVVSKLIPSAIRFDMASGRVRYFGATTHMNVLSRVGSGPNPQFRNTHWPIVLIVRDLSPDTHNYLMELFWDKHNTVIHLVHLDMFQRDQQHGGVEFYSTFLHLTMLATGFRYADKTREDIRRLTLPGYASSTLHEKAKSLAKLEIDRPGGIPSIQAFQLLGGLEFCCGNDDTGWLFTGMCFRMIFDAGLHVDPSSLFLPERETQIRHMVLWACMATDRLWSLYLGRPTTIKTSDVAPSCLSFDFSRMILCRRSWQEKKSTTRIYEALLRMMEIVSQLCDLRGPRPSKNAELYYKLAAIDQQLRDWRSSLPKHLKWSTELHTAMPAPYYLLHTQYHAAMILLHRPFVRYNEKVQEANSHFTNLSRNSCTESAKQIAEMFEHYRTRFDLEKVYGTAVQHAGTAATALMGEVVLQADAQERRILIEKLSSLRLSISLMSKNYQPAGQMTSVVDQFIRSVQGAPAGNPTRGSSFDTTTAAGGSTSNGGGDSFSAAAATAAAGPMNAHDVQDAFIPTEFDCLYAGTSGQRSRGRGDASYTITPSRAGGQSPSGLPFLPSSFLEGLSSSDLLFSELAGMNDCSFPWDENS